MGTDAPSPPPIVPVPPPTRGAKIRERLLVGIGITVGALLVGLWTADAVGLFDGAEEAAECRSGPSAEERFAALPTTLQMERAEPEQEQRVQQALKTGDVPDGVTVGLRYVPLPDGTYGTVSIIAGVPPGERDKLFKAFADEADTRGFRNVHSTAVRGRPARAMQLTGRDGTEATQVVVHASCSLIYGTALDEREATSLAETALPAQ